MSHSHRVKPRIETQVLTASSDREFFLIHGYTGSPTDFNQLAQYLHKRFDATVRVVRLPGHATDIRELDNLKYRDFIRFAEKELDHEIKSGKKVVVGGLSFGAQLSLILAARHPVAGVFHVCIPYRLRFPFNFRYLTVLKIFKKYWKKQYHAEELKLRQQAVYYDHMHIHGLALAHQANRQVSKHLSKIHVPCLMIHSMTDSIGHFRSIEAIRKKIRSQVVETAVYDYEIKNHNIFFSPVYEKVYKKIGDFVADSRIFQSDHHHDRVAAIVPAFNEGKHIERVLRTLTACKILDEIIVVDDASTDQTPQIVQAFKQVKYLRNATNQGKSFSMQRGVDATKAGILFFCDGDLEKFTPHIVEAIIRPVLDKKVDMFIGIRNNLSQKSFTPFAKLSGERSVRRELWNSLPAFYKHRFRVEVGLNYFSTFVGRGYDYQTFPYYQTLKEQKYGLVRGTWLRWGMNRDVALAYARAQFVDYFLHKIE